MGVKFYAVSYQKEIKKIVVKNLFKQSESKLEKTLNFFASTNLQNGMKTEQKKKMLTETLSGKIYFARLTPVGGWGLVTLNKQLFRQPVVEGKRFTK